MPSPPPPPLVFGPDKPALFSKNPGLLPALTQFQRPQRPRAPLPRSQASGEVWSGQVSQPLPNTQPALLQEDPEALAPIHLQANSPSLSPAPSCTRACSCPLLLIGRQPVMPTGGSWHCPSSFPAATPPRLAHHAQLHPPIHYQLHPEWKAGGEKADLQP